MSIRFLYFDIGNVLLSFSHERMCRQMGDVAGVAPELVAHALFAPDGLSEIQRLHETGAASSDVFYEHFCAHVSSQPDRAQLELAACDIFEPIASVISLVKQLDGLNHRLGLLSNTNQMHWDFITSGRFPLLEQPGASASCFDVVVASHEVGAMKPDAPIYHAAIERAAVAPQQIFFVDDRPENVAAAREHGIDAVQFTNADKLGDELQTRGMFGD